jgi:hypothetical protein
MGQLNGNNKTRTVLRATLIRANGEVVDLGVIADSQNNNINNGTIVTTPIENAENKEE